MDLLQHQIPDPPPITEDMTQFADGVGRHALLGKIVCVYDIPNSDRDEILMRYDDGRVICVSCDPGADSDGIRRTDDRWEVVLYDATETEAGKRMQDLESGHWL